MNKLKWQLRAARVLFSGKKEATAVKRAFVPHDDNSFTQKVTLLAILAVWGVLELANALTNITPPVALEWLRPLVIGLFARQIGVERGKIDSDGAS